MPAVAAAPKQEAIQKPPSVHQSTPMSAPPKPPGEQGKPEMTMATLGDALEEAAGGKPRAAAPAPAPAQAPAPEAGAPEPGAEPAEPQEQPTEPEGALEEMLSKKGKKPEPKPEAKPAEGEQAPAPAAPEPPISGPKALREAHAREKARAEKAEKALAEIQARSKDRDGIAEQYEALKKANEEAETKLRILDFEQSREYQDKYYKPLEAAWGDAHKFVAQLNIDDGQGGKRKATADDFNAMVSMDEGAATEYAHEKFGLAAERVLSRLDKLKDIASQRNAAVAEWKTKGGEMRKAQQAEATAARERLTTMWHEKVQAGAKAYPELFGEIEGDAEGNKLLSKGVAEADHAMGDLSGLSPEQRVEIHARIRNRAAAWPREVWRRQRAEAERDEALAELEEYRKSKPGKGQERKGESAAEAAKAPQPETLEGVLAQLDRL